jgi:hypothetical protein
MRPTIPHHDFTHMESLPGVIEQLEAQFARLGITDDPASARAVVGEPPWLYPPEFVLDIARTLPDAAGAAALGDVLAAARTLPWSPPPAR